MNNQIIHPNKFTLRNSLRKLNMYLKKLLHYIFTRTPLNAFKVRKSDKQRGKPFLNTSTTSVQE